MSVSVRKVAQQPAAATNTHLSASEAQARGAEARIHHAGSAVKTRDSHRISLFPPISSQNRVTVPGFTAPLPSSHSQTREFPRR
jgi:hypothetical protein